MGPRALVAALGMVDLGFALADYFWRVPLRGEAPFRLRKASRLARGAGFARFIGARFFRRAGISRRSV